MRDEITIRGAREHNLANIDVSIPRNRLVVITGTWRALAIAIKNSRVAARYTRLTERLLLRLPVRGGGG